MKNFFRVALSLGVLAGLVLLERKRPLRHERESKLRRNGRNLTVAALGALTAQLLEAPAVRPLARSVEQRKLGLLKQLNLPRPLEIIAAVVLMDYTLYLWHVLTHRVPFLWRFHAVHHVDLDLDASTALRFHFGELAVSVPYRAAQVVLIGVDAEALTLLADVSVIINFVSPFQCPPAAQVGIGAELVSGDAADAWHSSLERAG